MTHFHVPLPYRRYATKTCQTGRGAEEWALGVFCSPLGSVRGEPLPRLLSHGRCPFGHTGFPCQRRSSTTRSSMRFAGRSGVGRSLDAKIFGGVDFAVCRAGLESTPPGRGRPKKKPYSGESTKERVLTLFSLTPFLRPAKLWRRKEKVGGGENNA